MKGGTMSAAASTASQARRLTTARVADSCYFRSGPAPGARKALLKITDRCDLRCAHCFVSATADGADMGLEELTAAVPHLAQARVANVTITGGEPLLHPHLVEMLEVLVEAGIEVTVCTNAVSVTEALIETARQLGHVSFNVSVDGTTAESHGPRTT
jgi:MoaA/NifB/PqqE/SkfB family radical SAM enzyme